MVDAKHRFSKEFEWTRFLAGVAVVIALNIFPNLFHTVAELLFVSFLYLTFISLLGIAGRMVAMPRQCSICFLSFLNV